MGRDNENVGVEAARSCTEAISELGDKTLKNKNRKAKLATATT
jgi:hypothetical protein